MSSTSSSDLLSRGSFFEHSGSSSPAKKVMVCAVIVLFVVLIIIGILNIYARWFWRYSFAMNSTLPWSRRRRRRRFHFVISEPAQAGVMSAGLSKAVVDLLPTFVYTTNKFKEGLECAVCLSDFEEEEAGRTLPTCGHSFHISCIDMWFISNSTCPLCRVQVDKNMTPSENKAQVMANEEHVPTFVTVSVPLDADPNLLPPGSLMRDPNDQLARETSAVAAPIRSSRLVSSLSPRTICLTVRDSVSSSDRIFESCEEEIFREAAASRPSHGGIERPETAADAALQHNQAQTLQPDNVHCSSKSRICTSRLRSKKAPHLVVEVPRASATSCVCRVTSKTSNPSPSPSACKSPLSHLRSVRWLLVKDRRASTPTAPSCTTEMNVGTPKCACQPLESSLSCQSSSQRHRSLPSSPSG